MNKILIVGANGQLGRALRLLYPDAESTTHADLDITSPDFANKREWNEYNVIINASAYTKVDEAETPNGRKDAWLVNATGVGNLARVAAHNDITLVHISTDYVFDGKHEVHTETESLSPLGTYGQSKAAGDVIVGAIPRYYILRTSWVVGDGNNFVKTMKSLAERGIKPSVVNDQIGRLTFTQDLAAGIKHLLDTQAPYGTYNLTNDGEPASWADIAVKVYELSGKTASDITPVSTEQYYEGKEGIAPRPLQSTLNLAKIKATGFVPRDWEEALKAYLDNE